MTTRDGFRPTAPIDLVLPKPTAAPRVPLPTPGPWIAAPSIQNKQALVIGSPRVVSGPLADVYLPQHNLGFPSMRAEEREANARLIAAAPDMLEALDAVHKFAAKFDGMAERSPEEEAVLEMVHAAISKARGEA